MELDYHRHEDDYFLEQDAQKRARLRAELEAKTKEAHAKGRLGDAMGVRDEQVVQRARELGFDAESAKVMHLIPLVHVAWADGSVSAQERLTIMQAAEAHGVEPGSEASTFLATLLEERPPATWLEDTHDLLRTIAQRRGGHPQDIVELCREVASASGGFLGFGAKISDAEAELINRFASSLRPQAEREMKSLVE